MKYLRMFEAAAGLFPKRIKVKLIDAATGNYLSRHKISAELLPNAFNRPITLNIENINWRVLQADPIMADDFLLTKKLTLKVLQAATFDIGQLKYNLPTICSDLPTTEITSIFHDFNLEITESGWRQIEFIPLLQSTTIEEAIKTIEAILKGQQNPLLGYDWQYRRDSKFRSNLAIPLEKFCSQFLNPVKGNILYNNIGFIQSGFALQSDSHTYYGIQENGLIKILCLKQFDYVNDELMNILSLFQLSLVDWCNASRISAEVGEAPQSEFMAL